MTVEDIIHIEAAPDVVWAVTTDVERWPAWTPTVTDVRLAEGGPFGLGSVARIKQPGQPEAEWTVTEYVQGERFTWETQRAGLRMKATHEVAAVGGGTSNRLRVETSGVLAIVLWPMLRFAVQRALTAENGGLTEEAEGATWRLLAHSCWRLPRHLRGGAERTRRLCPPRARPEGGVLTEPT